MLRSIYIGLMVFTIYLFFTPYADYTVLTIIGLLHFSFLTITGLEVEEKKIYVIKYYCSGIVPIRSVFEKKDIAGVSSGNLEGEVDITDGILADDEAPLLSFFMMFIPNVGISKRVLTLDLIDSKRKKARREQITAEERDLILKF